MKNNPNFLLHVLDRSAGVPPACPGMRAGRPRSFGMRTHGRFSPRSRREHGGFALVLVLAFLVLITGLILAFFSSVSTDSTTSKSYASQISVNQLVDSSVQTVMAQIKTASSRGNGTVAWVSQPGMIRTYGTGSAASSAPLAYYKLYSSNDMEVTATEIASFDLLNDLKATPGSALTDWADQPAMFTDLNAPVGTSYPILDPAAATGPSPVEGFSLSTNPTLSPAASGNAAAMPVRWIYVLKDGTLSTPSGVDGTGKIANWSGVVSYKQPSATNPIVGRIAFWTDDETCKVNINTASEGTFWDVPRLLSDEEKFGYADNQPVQKEFQRYPGHPAMTSLAPIFFATSNSTTPNPLRPAQREALYTITPRVMGGGSEGGTVVASGSLTPDSDRLYASVDELIFKPNRTAHDTVAGITRDKLERARFFLTASSRAPEVTLFNTPRVAMWPIARDLVANKVTAYDKLIAFCSSLQNFSTDPPTPLPYYFQRSEARSPTADWTDIPRNRKLLHYLQSLSGKTTPGFDASLASKIGNADRDQLLVEMLDYIRCTNLYDDNLSPNTYANQASADNAVQFTAGRASNALATWPGHGAVAPLRVPAASISAPDAPPSYPTEPDTTSLMGFGRFATISEAGLLFIACADGKNGTFKAPLNDDGTPMLPTTPPSREQLARLASNVPLGTPDADRTFGYHFNTTVTPPTVISGNNTFKENKTLDPSVPLTSNQRRIQMMLFFGFFSPMQGWVQYAVDHSLDVELTGSFSINGSPVEMFTGNETVNFDDAGANSYHAWGGAMGYRKMLKTNRGRTVPQRGVMAADTNLSEGFRYGLVSAPLTITVPPDGTMTFSGPSQVTVRIYSRQSTRGRTAADLVQTIEMNFPNATFPAPVLENRGTAPNNDVGGTFMETWWTFHADGAFPSATQTNYYPKNMGRLGYSESIDSKYKAAPLVGTPYEYAGNVIRVGDTLRTLVPYHGDIRLVAGAHTVPLGVFQPSTFYFDTTRNDDFDNARNWGYSPSGTPPPPPPSPPPPSPPPQIQSYFTSSGSTRSDAFWAQYIPPVADRLVAGAAYDAYQTPNFPGIAVTNADRRSARAFQQFGDFDNGVALAADGAYVNKPDEGNNSRSATNDIPYFSQSWEQVAGGPTFFSPNRQVAGPGMFGSLPTRLRSANDAYNSGSPATHANDTWRTLLFRPQSGHPGAANPPDHLWMDFFWMPAVEPYAISEPFSTAGKINMNYAIAPFSYIRRATGIVALLRGERMLTIPLANANSYKTSGVGAANFRKIIDAHETLEQFDAKFANQELFRSASEICDIALIPQGSSYPLAADFWSSTNALTGDNSRERPYTNLQTRLTTKSNTYTVHYRVQSLKKSTATGVAVWDEGQDKITAEYRGSTTIERYIDPNDSRIPDYAASSDPTSAASLGNFYKWRVLNTRKFAP